MKYREARRFGSRNALDSLFDETFVIPFDKLPPNSTGTTPGAEIAPDFPKRAEPKAAKVDTERRDPRPPSFMPGGDGAASGKINGEWNSKKGKYMCGRYTLTSPSTKLFERFGLEGDAPELSPNYNVAPTQSVAAIIADEGGGRRLESFRWGLVPSWADDPAIGNRMINARSETAHEKPSFRSAWGRRRCLIPADGFYEWKKEDGGKQPFHIRMADGEPFAFAGLWETWDGGDGEVRTCAILTTEANEMMGEIHNRMPVILPEELYEIWLGEGGAEKHELIAMMEPYSSEDMEAYPVSRFVNKPSNNDPSCVEPVSAA